MPHSALRRIPGAALSIALAAVLLAATAPAATGATGATGQAGAEPPALKVLTYNSFLFSKTP
ncbi:hypothetical protein [Streptomyces sp. NPDC058280]|uniref:hypothetical protein n=1 Tax=Streptomyces sp. NPDC058280 TaxID=3346419 RepID=UPI0036E80815